MPISKSDCEVQLAHEKSEWAYAVYVMGADGCAYSRRFEYDADRPGEKDAAKKEAAKDFQRQIKENPGCRWYNDLTGGASG